jgi:hypothetical protein
VLDIDDWTRARRRPLRSLGERDDADEARRWKRAFANAEAEAAHSKRLADAAEERARTAEAEVAESRRIIGGLDEDRIAARTESRKATAWHMEALESLAAVVVERDAARAEATATREAEVERLRAQVRDIADDLDYDDDARAIRVRLIRALNSAPSEPSLGRIARETS